MDQSTNANTSLTSDGGSGSRRLNVKNISHHDYTLTLLSEASDCGLIGSKETDEIRIGITDALERAVMTFTGGESSSVMTETANSLLHSVLFAVDAYLLSLKNDYRAVSELKNCSIPQLYDLGMKQLKRMIYETLSLLAKCRAERVITPNIRYNETLDRQITEYLRTYNIATNAHVSCALSYKPILPVDHLSGIYRVKTAALYLSYENEFCRAYDKNEINAVYKRWCDQNAEPYDNAKTNIYELVYTCALLCDYLKKEHGTLSLSREDCDLVCRILEGYSEEKITEILGITASHLIYGNSDYNSRALGIISQRLTKVIIGGNLSNIIPVDTGS